MRTASAQICTQASEVDSLDLAALFVHRFLSPLSDGVARCPFRQIETDG